MDFLHSSVDGKRPSGVSIPWILRQRLKEQQAADPVLAAGSNAVVQEQSPNPGGGFSEASSSSIDPQIVFSSQEIEDRLLRTSQALTEIQKQIQRGEETYYEETQACYNSSLFRGFDTIIDARAVNNNLNSNSGHHHNNGSSMSHGIGGFGNSSNSNFSQSAGLRRMPADFRWFSSSSMSIHTTRHGNHAKSSSAITAASQTATLPPPTGVGVVSAAAPQVVQIRSSSGVGVVKKNAALATATISTGGHSGQPLPPPPSSSLPRVQQPSASTGGNRGTKRCTSAPTVVVGQKRPCLDTATTPKAATSETTTVDTNSSSVAAAVVLAAANLAKAAGAAAVPFEDSASAAAAPAAKGEAAAATAAAPDTSSSSATAPKTGEAKPRGRPPGKSDSSKRRPKRKRATGT